MAFLGCWCGSAAAASVAAAEADVTMDVLLVDFGMKPSSASLATTTDDDAGSAAPSICDDSHSSQRGPSEEIDTDVAASSVPSDAGAGAETHDLGFEEDLEAAEPDYPLELDARERSALDALRQALGEGGLDEVRETLVPGETLDSCLLRFLKVSSCRVPAAAKLLRAHLAWRRVERPSVMADQPSGEICGCPDELLDRYMPTWHQGFDKTGRPVVFSHYGKFRFKPILDAGVTVEKILRLHARNAERTARLCGEQSRKLGRNISNAFVVIDTEGWDPSNLRRAALDWAKGIARIDEQHYVERLGHLMIINAPASVFYFMRAISWLLPERTRDQVQVLAGPEQWRPALLARVDADQLPPEYGGCGPAMSSRDA